MKRQRYGSSPFRFTDGIGWVVSPAHIDENADPEKALGIARGIF